MKLAFEKIRKKLYAPPVLLCPDFRNLFKVEANESDRSLVAVRSQKDETGGPNPARFAS